MTVCNFFLQGRCRYGEKCWNEHPRGGGRSGGGGFNNSNRGPTQQQQQPRGGGGFGNRVWVNPSQQRGGYVQPSSFGSRENDQWSRRGDGGGSDWGGRENQGFGRRENIKSSEFSFGQNRFSALDSPSTFNKGGRAPAADDENDKKCEIIQNDMEIWESSGQWGFSTYSSSKNPLSGFTDLSPEELRFEYYTSTTSGNLQSYISGVNQLLNQWRSRVQELKVMNAATRAALLSELSNSAPLGSSTDFGSAPAFGFASKSFGASEQLSSFSFAAPASGFSSASAPPTSGFGSASTAPPPSGFGSASTAPPPSGFGSASTAPPPSGFGASAAPTASSFSFAASDKTSAPASTGFGSASGFSFSASAGGGFGTGFGAETPISSGTTSAFGQSSSSVAAPAPSVSGASDSLFSTETSLTAEELNQFKAKRFTLGQIPLKPPPANLLVL